MGRRVAGTVLALGLLAVACGSSGDDSPAAVPDGTTASGRASLGDFTEARVVVTAADGSTRESCLLLADEADEWSRGLMEVVDLGDHDGMVFVFPEDRTGGFFMRNTPMPLSIAFVDAQGRVVSTADMEPCEDRDGCPVYDAAGPYRVAVEVPEGELGALGLDGSDALLEVDGACPPL